MFTHILVPLDGSSLASSALDVVRHLADVRCKITLLAAVLTPDYLASAVSPLVSVLPPETTLASACADAQRYLETVAAPLRQKGFQVQCCVEIGDPAECIVQMAHERKVDLIAMSTHGRSGVNRLLFGSVTSSVLHQASCPVLVNPNRRVQQSTLASDESERLTWANGNGDLVFLTSD